VNVLLVPAHPGFPGQIPQSRKTVVCVCVFHPFPQKPPRGQICPKFGTVIGSLIVITCDKYFGDQLRDVDSTEVKLLPFPIDKPSCC